LTGTNQPVLSPFPPLVVAGQEIRQRHRAALDEDRLVEADHQFLRSFGKGKVAVRGMHTRWRYCGRFHLWRG
jgi:hypothetical protein